jgi:hypothetical protein
MKKIITIFISLLFFIGCSKSGDNINDVNNVDDYPELILGTWYLETIKSTSESYYIDPVFGTHNGDTLITSQEVDMYGKWITFEYDFDGYNGSNDVLTDTVHLFNYTLVNDSMIWYYPIWDNYQVFSINELNDIKLDFRFSNIDSVYIGDTLRVINNKIDYIYYREIITPIDTTNWKKIINKNNIYNKIRS